MYVCTSIYTESAHGQACRGGDKELFCRASVPWLGSQIRMRGVSCTGGPGSSQGTGTARKRPTLSGFFFIGPVGLCRPKEGNSLVHSACCTNLTRHYLGFLRFREYGVKVCHVPTHKTPNSSGLWKTGPKVDRLS